MVVPCPGGRKWGYLGRKGGWGVRDGGWGR